MARLITLYVPRNVSVARADLATAAESFNIAAEQVGVERGRTADVVTIEVDDEFGVEDEGKLRALLAGIIEQGRATTLDQLVQRVEQLEAQVRQLTGGTNA